MCVAVFFNFLFYDETYFDFYFDIGPLSRY